jgi:hypothetical protein
MPITESDWQLFNVTKPATIASAASVTPTSQLTVLSGNVAITTIVPPTTQVHFLALVFAGTAGVGTGGNIATAKASVVGEAMLLIYNPNTAKYSPIG